MLTIKWTTCSLLFLILMLSLVSPTLLGTSINLYFENKTGYEFKKSMVELLSEGPNGHKSYDPTCLDKRFYAFYGVKKFNWDPDYPTFISVWLPEKNGKTVELWKVSRWTSGDKYYTIKYYLSGASRIIYFTKISKEEFASDYSQATGKPFKPEAKSNSNL